MEFGERRGYFCWTAFLCKKTSEAIYRNLWIIVNAKSNFWLIIFEYRIFVGDYAFIRSIKKAAMPDIHSSLQGLMQFCELIARTQYHCTKSNIAIDQAHHIIAYWQSA
jgi:hypothetical protein